MCQLLNDITYLPLVAPMKEKKKRKGVISDTGEAEKEGGFLSNTGITEKIRIAS
jgi:hypothetical protein